MVFGLRRTSICDLVGAEVEAVERGSEMRRSFRLLAWLYVIADLRVGRQNGKGDKTEKGEDVKVEFRHIASERGG